MTGYLKVSGTHKSKRTHLKVSGAWKPCAVWLKVSGVWKQIEDGSGITLSTPFNPISDPVGGGSTDGDTPTFTVAGSPVTVTLNMSGTVGTLRVKINAGAFNVITDGGTFSVSNGDTVTFRLTASAVDSDTVYLSAGGFSFANFGLQGT